MAHSTEFAGMAPMIAKYFGSPNGKAAASATLAAAKQVLASDGGRAATANLPAARAAFTTAAGSRPQMQAAAMSKPSPSKAPSPLFVMPSRQPNTYFNGSALMRMHSSKQG